MNAIETVIAEVDGKIAELQGLRANLVSCLPIMYPAGVSPKIGPAPNGLGAVAPLRTVKRKYTKRAGVSNGPSPKSKVHARKLGERPGVMPSGEPPRAVKAGNPTTQALLDGKADTVSGAVKLLLRDETKPFTKELLRRNLEDDPDYKKLLEAEGGAKALENALYHWSNGGKLKKHGDHYTVTDAGKEWFSR